MNPEVTNDRGRHPFLDLPLTYMDTSELHRASGGSTDKNLPTLLQVNTRAPKGTTSAFPVFPGERIQAVAAGTLHRDINFQLLFLSTYHERQWEI